MRNAKILIIDACGDCSLFGAKVLAPGGYSVLTASSAANARQLLADSRPDLVLADCSVAADPLAWLEEIHRLNLAAQLIVTAEAPDFRQAMDWVAGGAFNVVARPLDDDHLLGLILAALETCETFKMIASTATGRSDQQDQARLLADFYHGLAGRLDGQDLKSYIVDSVTGLTGARRVELCLVEGLSGASYSLETHTVVGNRAGDHALPPAPVSGCDTNNCRLGFELSAAGRHLGEIYLYFEDKNDLAIRRRETLAEVVAAASSALNSAARYQKAVNLAARDGLTGLYNRRIFNEVLQREFAKARRHNFNLSLLTLDLDHFKSVNDNFGHQTGDLVLQDMAAIITKVSRTTDLPARIGGEEFAVILPHTSQDQARVLADRLKKMLAEHDFNLPGIALHQTVSQGVAGLEHFMVKSPEDMLYFADQALYLAKREGRDTIRTIADLPVPPVMQDGIAYAFQ